VIALTAHTTFAIAERKKHHATDNARQAAAFLDVVGAGFVKKPFQLATTVLVALPAALVALASLETFAPIASGALGAPIAPIASGLFVLAGITAVAGLYLYEQAFVRAGQLPPLS